MTWQVIAHHDGRVTAGRRSTKALLALFTIVVLLAAYVYPVVGEDPITTARFSGFVDGILTTLLPLIGILLGYNAVVTERESGALLLSLSLPHSREDVVVGKVLGRTGVLAATIVATMVGAGFLVVYPFGDLELVRSVAFVVLTVALGTLWTCLGVAVSLAVATKQRALVLGFGLFFLFALVWDTVVGALESGLNAAGIIDGSLPGPVAFVLSLDPGTAFERLTAGFIDPAAAVDGPWYLSEWVALVVFVGWLVVPVVLASRRFAGRDLQ